MEKTKKKKVFKILAAIFVPPLVLAFALWCWIGYEFTKFDIKPELGKYELRDDVYSGELEITKISKKEYKAANGINVFTNKKGKKFYRIKCSIAGEDGVMQEIEFVNLQIFYDEPSRPGGLETEDGIWMIEFGSHICVREDYNKENELHLDFYKI
ncbi:MAG TPA: hypothetical protein DEQ88_01085 [Clostridiales bacterium]|nr:hypothetical protein [Clostridiales bacterium]